MFFEIQNQTRLNRTGTSRNFILHLIYIYILEREPVQRTGKYNLLVVYPIFGDFATRHFSEKLRSYWYSVNHTGLKSLSCPGSDKGSTLSERVQPI